MFSFLFVPIPGGIPDKHPSLTCFITFDISVTALSGSTLISSSSSEDHFFKNSCKFFSILSDGGVGCFLVCPISFLSRKHNLKSLIMTCLTSLSLDVTPFLGIFSKILLIAWNKSSLIKTLLPNMAFILFLTVQQLSIIIPFISCCAFWCLSYNPVRSDCTVSMEVPLVSCHASTLFSSFITINTALYNLTHFWLFQ